MKRLLCALLALLLVVSAASALSCSADSTKTITLGSTLPVSVSCTSISSSVSISATNYDPACLTVGTTPSLTSTSSTGTVDVQALSNSCSASQRRIDWRFTQSGDTPISKSTQVTVTTSPSLSAYFNSTSITVTSGASVDIILGISRAGDVNLTSVTINATTTSGLSGITNVSAFTIYTTQGQVFQTWSITAPTVTSAGVYTINATVGSAQTTSDSASMTLNVNPVTSQQQDTTTTTTGGGGGGGLVQVISEAQTITTLAAGESTTLSFAKAAEIAISKIQIEALNTISNAQVTIQQLTSKPSSIKTAPVETTTGNVYLYLSLSKTINDVDISKIKMTFNVNKTWLSTNSIDASTVKLYRYASSQWNALETTKLSETSSEVTYEAITPGFSTFAIAGEKSTAAAQPPAEPPTQPLAQPPAEPPTQPPSQPPAQQPGQQTTGGAEPPAQEPEAPTAPSQGLPLLPIAVGVIVVLAAVYWFGFRKT